MLKLLQIVHIFFLSLWVSMRQMLTDVIYVANSQRFPTIDTNMTIWFVFFSCVARRIGDWSVDFGTLKI